jgi:prepilin-type N-terminal cleavage/methylation domain-containing protein
LVRDARRHRDRQPRPNGRGFSLIEVVVVCVMLTIVAAAVVPRLIVVQRQREQKAILEVEDLLRMYAFRNSVGTQQIGLYYDRAIGEVSLWIKDLDPRDPLGPRVWQQDRLSNPVELPEGMDIARATADGIEMIDDAWNIPTHPDGSRPSIVLEIAGREEQAELVLEPYATVPVRVGERGAFIREAIDLDREGRTFDTW